MYKNIRVPPRGNTCISKMPDFDGFLFWYVKTVKVDLMVNGKMYNIKRKICAEKRINTPLKDLTKALNNHGWHGLLTY